MPCDCACQSELVRLLLSDLQPAGANVAFAGVSLQYGVWSETIAAREAIDPNPCLALADQQMPCP